MQVHFFFSCEKIGNVLTLQKSQIFGKVYGWSQKQAGVILQNPEPLC